MLCSGRILSSVPTWHAYESLVLMSAVIGRSFCLWRWGLCFSGDTEWLLSWACVGGTVLGASGLLGWFLSKLVLTWMGSSLKKKNTVLLQQVLCNALLRLQETHYFACVGHNSAGGFLNKSKSDIHRTYLINITRTLHLRGWWNIFCTSTPLESLVYGLSCVTWPYSRLLICPYRRDPGHTNLFFSA